jgi:hypothetical protein
MARTSDMLAVGLDGDTLLLCRQSVAPGKVVVERMVAALASADLDLTDAAAVGAWLARVASEHRLPLRRVTFVAGREEVVLKRMSVPGGDGLSAAELTGLVRLSLSRQMTMAIDGAGIDHIRVGGESKPGSAATVVAAALPADRLSWYKAVAGAAGAKIAGIELALTGAGAIARDAALRRDGPSLCVAIGRGAVEFVLLENGQVSTARAVEMPAPKGEQEVEQYAARVVVEARRTWMGWAGGRETQPLESLLLLGVEDLCDRVRARCADAALASAVRTIGLPASVSIKDGARSGASLEIGAGPGEFLPLIGIGIAHAENLDRFDFIRVKRGPDPRARRRQLILSGAFGLIIAVGGAWVLAQMRLGELRDARDAARQAMNKAGTQYAEMLVQEVRADSVEHWANAGMDWLGHLKWLSEQMPAPKDGLLDEITASMSADVQFTPRNRSVAGAQWTTRQEAVFSLSGKVVRREIALDLRGRLVRGDLYKVVNQSADTEDRFSFDLVTSKRSPSDPPTATPPAAPSAKPAQGSAAAPSGGGRGT